jgi:hypothetical protein
VFWHDFLLTNLFQFILFGGKNPGVAACWKLEIHTAYCRNRAARVVFCFPPTRSIKEVLYVDSSGRSRARFHARRTHRIIGVAREFQGSKDYRVISAVCFYRWMKKSSIRVP